MNSTSIILKESLISFRRIVSVLILFSILVLSFYFDLIDKFIFYFKEISNLDGKIILAEHIELVFFPIMSFYVFIGSILCLIINLIKPLKSPLTENGLILLLSVGLFPGLFIGTIPCIFIESYVNFFLYLIYGGVLGFSLSFGFGLKYEFQKTK